MAEPVLLQGVFDRTERVLAGIGDGQWQRPTPCPDYDVGTLAGHLVEFLQTFAAAVSGQAAETGRPAGDEPARGFRASTDRAVQAWRDGAAERMVAVGDDELPGAVVFDLMLVECLAHGWDLAVATAQPVPYTDAEADAALAAVTPMLSDDSRGEQFGPAVPVPADAAPLARLIGFLGRDPGRGLPG